MLPRVKGHGTRPLTRLAMVAAALGLFLVGYYWGNQYRRGDSTPPVIEGVLIRPPRPLPAFELRDAAGRSFTTEHLSGHWTLLSFGDSSQAPGQSAVMRMIEVYNRLASAPGLQEKLLLVLAIRRKDLPPDSESDHWSPVLRLLGGEAGEMQPLRIALGLPVEETAATADQALPCYLIGPSGRLSALFPSTQAPVSIASDLSAIAARSDTPESTDD